MLYDLMSERKQPSFSWAWYVTVALQRIHGISPKQLRDIRARSAPSTGRAPVSLLADKRQDPTTQIRLGRNGPATSMDDLRTQIQAVAIARSMR